MTRLPADLLPALPADLRAEHLPVLPAWFPLDPKPTKDDPHPLPYTDEVRARRRQAKAARHAIEGPFDGQRFAVELAAGGTPPAFFIPFEHQHVRYRLDAAGSTRWRLRYRYDPDSPVHVDLMRAVTEAYAQAGPDYTIASREETDDDRTRPNV